MNATQENVVSDDMFLARRVACILQAQKRVIARELMMIYLNTVIIQWINRYTSIFRYFQ